MKHIIIILGFVFLSAQGIKKSTPTILEKAVFKQLNLYRKQHGLKPLVYDSTVTTVARYHARYLGIASNLGHHCHYDKGPHDEQFDVPNFTEMNFDKRTAMAPEKNIYGEIQIQNMSLLKNQTPEEFAVRTISCFASSPPHNEAMLEPGFEDVIFYMGVAVVQHPKTDNDEDTFYAVNIDFSYHQIEK
jgi:uncharacterized protein YkwD